jgi:hypothetical protein
MYPKLQEVLQKKTLTCALFQDSTKSTLQSGVTALINTELQQCDTISTRHSTLRMY